jgi:hypothetical protein
MGPYLYGFECPVRIGLHKIKMVIPESWELRLTGTVSQGGGKASWINPVSFPEPLSWLKQTGQE